MSDSVSVRQIEIDDVNLGPSRSPVLSLGEIIGLYAVSIFGALAISALLVELTGSSWQTVFTALVDGSIGNAGRVGVTIGVAVPLLLVAIGTIVNGKAGLVNIGQEGQLLIGAMCTAWVALNLGGPGTFVIVVSLIAGVLGGGLWAGVAAGLRYRRNVPEVLTTLLMVNIAAQVVGYAVKNDSILLAPYEGRGARLQQSEQLAADTRMPRFTWFGNEFPTAVFIALLLAAVVSIVLARSIWGFRLRMLGRNPRTARRSGVSPRRYGTAAMWVSGGFAGLAGAVMLTGGDFGNYRFTPGFAVNIGWTGLLVALVARERVLMAIPVAFVFAGLRTGSGFLAATGVERRITDVVQALLVLALLIPPAVLFIRERRRAAAATRERT